MSVATITAILSPDTYVCYNNYTSVDDPILLKGECDYL